MILFGDEEFPTDHQVVIGCAARQLSRAFFQSVSGRELDSNFERNSFTSNQHLVETTINMWV